MTALTRRKSKHKECKLHQWYVLKSVPQLSLFPCVENRTSAKLERPCFSCFVCLFVFALDWLNQAKGLNQAKTFHEYAEEMEANS